MNEHPAASAPSPWSEPFETPAALARAEVAGRVSIDGDNPFKGAASLKLARDKADMDSGETFLVTEGFPVTKGRWTLGVALRSALHSPDSSYNGTVTFEAFNADDTVVARIEVAIVTGGTPWKFHRKTVELMADVVSGRFVIRMEKTHGAFHVDALSATWLGPSLRTVAAIKYATKAVGNLFLPGDPLQFDVTVECVDSLPEECRRLTCVVRDYWGVEYAGPVVAGLRESGRTTSGRFAYAAHIDFSGAAVEQGRYYEVHGEVPEPALPEPAREGSTFAVLPEAVTRKHPPLDIPFTASGWNPGVPGFFPLCDRLGFRVTNIYGGWSATPPYESTAPGLEEVKALGMGALMRSMASMIEGRRKGYEAYDETALREGARRMVLKYKDEVPLIIRNGNEPHPADDAQAMEMINAYRAIYEGVKAADPSVIVTSTSCGPEEQFFRLGFQRYYDVYDFHQYADADVIPADFERHERLVEKYGGRKPVWSTEIGQNSQGMSREAVAIQMVKIFTHFFACGGENASWFGIMWPDPDGSLVGSNGDSFDIFHSKYCLYCPKLTAVTEYHFINALCIKRFVASRRYPGRASATLFRDRDNHCLLVAWKDGGRADVFLPMPGVGAVSLTHLDGGPAELDANGAGLTLTLWDEPVMLTFDSADFTPPDALGEPRTAIAEPLPSIVKGGRAGITFRGAPPAALTLPPRWTATRAADRDGDTVCLVSAPETTGAREARLFARLNDGGGELALPLTVLDTLAIRLVPRSFRDEVAGIGFEIRNHGSTARTVRWRITMPETFPMSGGTFRLNQPDPFEPDFEADADGELTVDAGGLASASAMARNLDPNSLYRAVLEIVVDGRTITRGRLFGGCVGVPKARHPVAFDGRMGDPAWRDAPAIRIDQPSQHAVLTRSTARRDKPEDLSGTMRLLWDDDCLYIGMAVEDDVFSNPECDAAIWRGDGLQFLVDPCRDADDKPGKYDYCLGLGTKGPQAWCGCTADAARAPTEEVTDFRMSITPTGHRGDVVYEVAIPWRRLSPFEPGPGANLGLAMIINDDDGRIRDSFIAWFGCAHSKQMSMNGDLILLG